MGDNQQYDVIILLITMSDFVLAFLLSRPFGFRLSYCGCSANCRISLTQAPERKTAKIEPKKICPMFYMLNTHQSYFVIEPIIMSFTIEMF